MEIFGPNFKECFEALFTYRNEMMHNGYEWPEERRNSSRIT